MQNGIFARQRPDPKMKFEFNGPRSSKNRRSSTPIDISSFYIGLCATSTPDILRWDLEQLLLRQVLRGGTAFKTPPFLSWFDVIDCLFSCVVHFSVIYRVIHDLTKKVKNGAFSIFLPTYLTMSVAQT